MDIHKCYIWIIIEALTRKMTTSQDESHVQLFWLITNIGIDDKCQLDRWNAILDWCFIYKFATIIFQL